MAESSESEYASLNSRQRRPYGPGPAMDFRGHYNGARSTHHPRHVTRLRPGQTYRGVPISENINRLPNPFFPRGRTYMPPSVPPWWMVTPHHYHYRHRKRLTRVQNEYREPSQMKRELRDQHTQQAEARRKDEERRKTLARAKAEAEQKKAREKEETSREIKRQVKKLEERLRSIPPYNRGEPFDVMVSTAVEPPAWNTMRDGPTYNYFGSRPRSPAYGHAQLEQRDGNPGQTLANITNQMVDALTRQLRLQGLNTHHDDQPPPRRQMIDYADVRGTHDSVLGHYIRDSCRDILTEQREIQREQREHRYLLEELRRGRLYNDDYALPNVRTSSARLASSVDRGRHSRASTEFDLHDHQRTPNRRRGPATTEAARQPSQHRPRSRPMRDLRPSNTPRGSLRTSRTGRRRRSHTPVGDSSDDYQLQDYEDDDDYDDYDDDYDDDYI